MTIEIGMLVECNIESLDQSLPKEKRTRVGYVVRKLKINEEDVLDVNIFHRDMCFRPAMFAPKDVQPLSVPIPEYVQRDVLAMNKHLKEHFDLMRKWIDRAQAALNGM